jgi:hypothetical protein
MVIATTYSSTKVMGVIMVGTFIAMNEQIDGIKKSYLPSAAGTLLGIFPESS